MSKSTTASPGRLPAAISPELSVTQKATTSKPVELSPRTARLARAGWFGLVIFTFIMALAGFPYYLQGFNLCADATYYPCFSPQLANTLQDAGISFNAY